MVELSPPSPSEEASPNNDTKLAVRPDLSVTSSPPPRAASPPSHDENADALLSRSSSPPTVVTPTLRAASPEMNVRPATEQPRKPSRQSSPHAGSPGRRSPDPTLAIKVSDTPRIPGTPTNTTGQIQDGLTPPRPTPSPLPLPRSPKGKGRADDYPPAADSDSDSDSDVTPAWRATLGSRRDNERISDDASGEQSANPRLLFVPDEKQLEIDHVIAAIPMEGPRIEADTNIEADDSSDVDEGFYGESMESRYQAFLAATENMRARRRPFHRIGVPGNAGETMPAHMGLTQKPIRMRTRRMPKPCSPTPEPSASTSSSSAPASYSRSSSPASPSSSPPTP